MGTGAGRRRPVDAHRVPGLDVRWDEAHGAIAINDLTVIRDGPGQVLVSVSVDDVLYARVAGDGIVVATPLGSSAYTMAAGGPILAPGAEGIAVTPLAPHGGVCPPLVAGIGSRLTLTIEPGHGGVRHEIDGRRAPITGGLVAVAWRPDYAVLVRLAEGEPRLTGLRRRGLVLDSPRALVRGARSPEGATASTARASGVPRAPASSPPTAGGPTTISPLEQPRGPGGGRMPRRVRLALHPLVLGAISGVLALVLFRLGPPGPRRPGPPVRDRRVPLARLPRLGQPLVRRPLRRGRLLPDLRPRRGDARARDGPGRLGRGRVGRLRRRGPAALG